MRADLCEYGFYECWALQMWILWELSMKNVNFMRAERCKCEFHEGWALWMWICESWSLRIWIWRALSIVNVNFMKAELCICGFYESWALRMWCGFWMWILWELSFVNFMRAEFFKCEFYGSWAFWMWFYESCSSWIWIWWELSFANVNFLRTEHFECEFYESWALQMWILWSWALQMWISWELSFSSVHVMSARLCIFWVLSFYILPEDQCVVALEVKNPKGGWENLSRHKMELKSEMLKCQFFLVCYRGIWYFSCRKHTWDVCTWKVIESKNKISDVKSPVHENWNCKFDQKDCDEKFKWDWNWKMRSKDEVCDVKLCPWWKYWRWMSGMKIG